MGRFRMIAPPTESIAAAAEASASIHIGDWQFWMVSFVALAGVSLLVRPLLPSKSPTPPCGGCAKSSPAKPRHATLTIEGDRPS